MKTVYLDNAATTFPKPPVVIQAVTEAMRYYGNPGRGSHKISLKAAELVYDCREAAAEMFSAEPENVVFTMNATQSLNYAIKGLVNKGDHVLIDNIAHNASYRPLMTLCTSDYCTADVYNFSDCADIEEKIKENTTVIIATHQSNITSNTSTLEFIGDLCEKRGIKLIVDASQSAGHLPIDMKRQHITSLCIPGHKGLFSPMGVGLLISSPGTVYKTTIEGGAGINSLDLTMPDELPERLEAGTLPLPAIAGLLEGIRFVKKIGIENIHKDECKMAEYAVMQLSKNENIEFYGDCSGPVFSFNIKDYLPAEIGKRLNDSGICVRTGYHCAPIAHKTFGSYENGSVRVSFSYMNRMTDAEYLVHEINKLCFHN